MSYKVTFLNDEEFERLPGNNMEGKIGVAYPNHGEAYVRKSGSNLVDVFSAMHELEHLQGSDRGERFDQENQCYYKDFGETMSQFFQSSIPGTKAFQQNALGPLAGAAGTAIGGPGVGAAAYQGVGSYQDNERMKNSFQYQAQPQMEALEAPYTTQSPQAPFTSQAQGGGTAAGGNAGGNAIKSLSQQPQFGDIQSQRYGNISGRSPLMSIFGG